MKKSHYIVGCILLSIGIIFALIIASNLVWYKFVSPEIVFDFNVNDYDYYLTEFAHDDFVGHIDDAETAKQKGIAVIKEVYGEACIHNEKPFTVGYDQANDVWYISGSMPLIPLITGGVANVIISGADGDVLAVWHTK